MMNSQDLMQMNDQELVEFADRTLCIVIPPGTARSKILTIIVNATVAVPDGFAVEGGA